MKDQRILLVEDSPAMQTVITSLVEPVCRIESVSSLRDAEAKLLAENYSLLLLDVMLPDGNGFDYCARLRSDDRFKDLPLIFLTSKDAIEDRVRGLKLGADDYVVKPIEPKEFLARVEAKLRKSAAQGALQTSFSKTGFRIDLTAQHAFMTSEFDAPADAPKGPERRLDLTPIEFRLLVNFLKNTDQVYSRDQLRSTIWGGDVHVAEHTVDTHISALRKKIGSWGVCLRAVVKQGYTFSVAKAKRRAG